MKNFTRLKALGEQISILYVEDNDDLRESFSTYLKKFFKSVKVCVDGKDSLDAYKNVSYD